MPSTPTWAKSDLLSHVKHPLGGPWGFVIYRTTYTSYSNRRFPELINIFNSYLKRDILKEDSLEPLNLTTRKASGPRGDFCADYDLIWAHHRPIIMDDPAKFNGLSLPAVRSHFESWVGPEDSDKVSHRPGAQEIACLVVDEEVMDVLAAAAPYRKNEMFSMELYNGEWVKAVEAYADTSDPEWWNGTLKVPIRALWRFWESIGYTATMEHWGPSGGIFES
ncbi:hypothetical protein BJX99DRAFT_139189 [Aspergillus californicus]